MSKTIAFALVVFSLNAWAGADGQAANACNRFLPCGSFEGPMTDQAGTEISREEMNVSEQADGRLLVGGRLVELDGSVRWKYEFVFEFGAHDHFIIYDKTSGEVRGDGFCAKSLCSYATIPVNDAALVGILSFTADSIQRSHQLHADSEEYLAVAKMKRVN